MDEYDYVESGEILDLPELPKDLDADFTQLEMQKEISKNWKSLKSLLKKSELSQEVKKAITDFDELINYWL